MLRARWWRHRRWKELSGRELELEKPHREREVCFIARHGRASHIEMPQKRRRFRRCRNFQFVVLVVTASEQRLSEPSMCSTHGRHHSAAAASPGCRRRTSRKG